MTPLAPLLALATAAGIDLHLTVLALGAAALLGWSPLPAELEYLGLPWILAVMAGAYLTELVLERHPRAGTAWHAFQIPARALGGALLVLLGLSAAGPARPVAAVLGGAVALLVHLHLLGARFLLSGLGDSRPPSPRVVSLAQDAVALGLVALALDLPLAGAAAAGLLILGLALGCRGCLRAAPFALRLLRGAARRALGASGWVSEEGLPSRVAAAMDGMLEPRDGARLQGVPVGIARPGSAARFRTGWLVRARGRLFLVAPPARRPEPLELPPSRDAAARHPLLERVALGDPEGRTLLLPLDGPGAGELAIHAGGASTR